MGTFNKTRLEELFFENSISAYSILLIEHRSSDGAPTSCETMKTLLNASVNLLNASFVYHFAEIYDNKMICYLNYEPEIFSIRAFASTIRQTIYQLLPGMRTYLHYSQGIVYKEDLFSERFFLLKTQNYAMLFGNYRPLRCDFLHECEQNTTRINPEMLTALYSDLCEKKYERAADYLIKQAELFRTPDENSICYCFDEIYQYMSDCFAAIKLFFRKTGYELSFLDKRLCDLLYSENGVSGVLKLFSESICTYAKAFKQHPVRNREQEFMKNVYDYINENLGSTNMSETAAHFDLNTSYFCRLFKKNAGIGYNEYIRDKRLETAIMMLREDKKTSIAQISAMLGYKSRSHFQNSFKLKYGITPEGYRRNLRLQH